LTEKLSEIGVKHTIVESGNAFDPKMFMDLARNVREQGIALIHSHEFLMNTYGTAVAMAPRRPNIATVHGKGYYIDKWRRRAAYRFISRCSFRIVAVSESLKEFLIQKVRLDSKDISIICNGVDLKRFLPGDEGNSSSLKTELGLNGVVIGAVGNLYPVKGHIHLVRAARRILEEAGNAYFVLVGKTTDYSNTLREEVDRLGMTDRFRFLGFRTDIPRIMQMLDIFVLPSNEETFSIAILEAMAASKPVVATRCGGPDGIITDGKNGFLVEPGNPEQIAARVLELIRNPSLCSAFAEEGLKLARDKYTIDAMYRHYWNLYDEALSESFYRKVI
jgi:glycosyltransferase involved in cell wall biosynthesis